MAQYAIIEFAGSQLVEVVPVSWLTAEEDMCYWPPSRNKLAHLIKSRSTYVPTWEQYRVRVLGKAGI